MATEIIRVDVVEHAYDEDKAGRITKSERTSEEKKLTQEERDKKKRQLQQKVELKRYCLWVYGLKKNHSSICVVLVFRY